MNSIFIVLPILTILMFDLGLTLGWHDFAMLSKRPKSVVVGMVGQLILLPLIGFAVASVMHLSTLFFIGVVLIACCPGGSSSNVFSKLAKADVALSVSLTAISSVVTLFTLPFIMEYATSAVGETVGISLPVGNLLAQNLLTMLLPLAAGILVKKYFHKAAERIDAVLSRCAFPALMLLAGIFFVQHRDTIAENISTLGVAVTGMLLCSLALASVLGRSLRLQKQERRTINIEVGMQNAAQAIAIASSPYVFNDGRIAIPAIIYALMMNLVLLTYVGVIRYAKKEK